MDPTSVIEHDDPLLLYAHYSVLGFTIQCWAIDPIPTDQHQSPVDDEFVVNLVYNKFGTSRDLIFKMMYMEEEYCRGNVVEWVEKLGVEETVFEPTVKAVLCGIETLTYQVQHLGRKSLAMMVEINFFEPTSVVPDPNLVQEANINVSDEDEEDEPTYEEEEEEEDEEGNEVVEEQYRMAKGMLEASGVRFDEVTSVSNNKVVKIGCCPICLDEFGMEDDDQVQVAVMPACSHVLHLDCLLPWIVNGGSNCPLCRSQILSPVFMEEC